MVKVAELQLNNLIIDQHGDVVFVKKITEGKLDLQFEDMVMADIDPGLCDPVPISPEWLVQRYGFEAFNREGCYIRKIHEQGELMLFSTDSPVAQSNGFPPGRFYYMFGGIAHFIDHLHQIQNLYHILSGEELAITQPVL